VEAQSKEEEELASARAFVAAFPELFKQENFGESPIHQTSPYIFQDKTPHEPFQQ
jgi:hypothetical protein